MMRSSSYLFLSLLLCFLTSYQHAESRQLRIPQPDLPGLLIPDDAIPLRSLILILAPIVSKSRLLLFC